MLCFTRASHDLEQACFVHVYIYSLQFLANVSLLCFSLIRQLSINQVCPFVPEDGRLKMQELENAGRRHLTCKYLILAFHPKMNNACIYAEKNYVMLFFYTRR